MVYEKIKKELYDYYFEELPLRVEYIRLKVFQIMDEYADQHPGASSYALKTKLYDVIADNIVPEVFEDIPFAFETGALLTLCDGRYDRGGDHANGWLIERNMHLYKDFDFENYKKYMLISDYFCQCGMFSDYMHMGIPMKKIFSVGLSGVLDELSEAKKSCTTVAETEFIDAAEAGILALRKIALKLSECARKKGMDELADMMQRVPFEAPKTFHEGLCTLGFMRKALGTIEGYGFSSMGRPDYLLGALYENDKKNGISDEHMLDLVSRFLLIWDSTNDRRVTFDGAWSYELENSLTLGGCDDSGAPLFNGVTKLFITARDNLRCTYPKMMLRFSKNSPEEYMRLICKSLVDGKGYSLYQNDDVTIPALVSCGTELSDAQGYIVGGCWDVITPETNNKYSGEYFHLIRPFQMLMKEDGGKLTELECTFKPFVLAESFEELYKGYIDVVSQMVKKRISYSTIGAKVWDRVNPACALSALMEPCIKMKKDMTAGGIKYSREVVYYTCFAEICDSLYAIKKLCFDDKICTMQELFSQCDKNWENEDLRQKVLELPSYGDGSEEAAAFAGRFFDDLCEIADEVETSFGGKCRPGFNLYTEIVHMGARTGALPNGRRTGEYLTQGITPSRIGKNPTLYDMLDGMKYIDFKKTSGNASITLTLPAGKVDEEKMAALLRVLAHNGLQAIQPNCVNREELLAAQKDPENHKDIIVRVCGFSAPFVCLAPDHQDEIISRHIAEV
ncbi:MAG: hypothetical protein J6B23_06470 [Clostridia bacterium]|nr:hypothetical protein [Clostridia bacterium]MBP3580853.1 hypothetical protein [Clostridia bacterium]